jgi:hypothetical protein
MSPVRYELKVYILFRRNPVSKELIDHLISIYTYI